LTIGNSHLAVLAKAPPGDGHHRQCFHQQKEMIAEIGKYLMSIVGAHLRIKVQNIRCFWMWKVKRGNVSPW